MIDQKLYEKIQAKFPNGKFPAPFSQSLDIKLTRYLEGEVVAEVTVREEWLNPFGIAHGGFLFTLLDEILGAGAATVMDKTVYGDAKAMTTASHNIFFHAPAHPGATLMISANVLSARRTLITMEGQIRKKKDESIVATSKGLWYVIR